MLLRWSLNNDAAADAIEQAVSTVLARGVRTADIAADGQKPVSTTAMTDAVLESLN
jgi:3-isopropylmalate dehydrogenase